MSENKDIDIKSKENSGTIIGCEGDVHISNGLGYQDVKLICEDMIKRELAVYSDEANATAEKRLEEMFSLVLKRLEEKKIENEKALIMFKDPGVQDDIKEAGKAYAKRGTDSLKKELIGLICKRADNYGKGNELLDIVLGEAIKVSSKLTTTQFRILAFDFLIGHTMEKGITSKEQLGDFYQSSILPLIDGLITKQSDFEHLSYTSCASLSALGVSLFGYFSQYEGLFSKGLTASDLSELKGILPNYEAYLVSCKSDSSKKEFNYLNKKALEDGLKENKNLSADTIKRIINIYSRTVLNENEFKVELIKLNPAFQQFFTFIETTRIQNITLSSVGIVIGAEYLESLAPDEWRLDLSIWI